ncbi:hypothetical protein YC2023_094586 [Brassica napus]
MGTYQISGYLEAFMLIRSVATCIFNVPGIQKNFKTPFSGQISPPPVAGVLALVLVP